LTNPQQEKLEADSLTRVSVVRRQLPSFELLCFVSFELS
jgi:hypothetical protein